jgi:hypothetical protein
VSLSICQLPVFSSQFEGHSSALYGPDLAPPKGAGVIDAEKDVGNLSNGSTSSSPEDDVTVIAWEKNDPENPYNWSRPRKNYIVFLTVLFVLNATLGSALPANIVPLLSQEWHIESTYQKILPISVYIIG